MREEGEMISEMLAPIHLQYNFTAERSVARFLVELKEGRLLGMRCPKCKNVYFPPRGSCTLCGIPLAEGCDVTDKGTIESFTIVHVPIPGNPITPPFVVANLLLDGADVPLIHLVSGCDNADVHIGMRVQAVWRPRDEWGYKLENIEYFRPADEPDGRLKLGGKQSA